MSDCCIWEYRPGRNNSHWALSMCDKRFKYLSKLNDSEFFVGVADYYNGIVCPSCGKIVKMSYDLLGG